MFPYEDPERGMRVLNMAVPFGAGVTVHDNWDTLGMRGTGSNDVTIDDVFVPDEKILADRPYGVVDPPLQVIASIALLDHHGVYLGVAESAAKHALLAAAAKATDPTVQRQVGLMQNRLQVARGPSTAPLAVVGDDPAPSMETVAAIMAAKREIAHRRHRGVRPRHGDRRRRRRSSRASPIERAYRDIRGVKFHPFTPEATLLHAGRLALGQPCDQI